ncbi:MAG: class I SAM-dependent methyltransferase [Acidimicrobiales bacterium]
MVHDAAAAGYRSRSDTYARARPTYHPTIVDRLVAEHGEGDVVELGAGTGIFTAQLVQRGVRPLVVEPVAEMRTRLGDALPAISAVDGTAEATGLPDACADTVVAAQAFHWFDHAAALDEVARLLRPGGALVCVWNVRDTSVPWVAAVTEILDRHAGNTPRHRTMAWRRAIDDDPRFVFGHETVVDNPVPATPQTVVDRSLSTSFIAALEPAAQAAVVDEVRAVAEPLGDSFDYPYRSELQVWELSGSGR